MVWARWPASGTELVPVSDNRLLITDQQALTGRLRQALLAFETARQVFMRAQGRLNGLPMKKVAAYWQGPGQGIEQRMRSAAAAVVVAHRACLVAGLSADAKDQHVIVEARRHSEGG